MDILFSAILLFRNVHEQMIQEKIVYLVNKIAPQRWSKKSYVIYKYIEFLRKAFCFGSDTEIHCDMITMFFFFYTVVAKNQYFRSYIYTNILQGEWMHEFISQSVILHS